MQQRPPKPTSLWFADLPSGVCLGTLEAQQKTGDKKRRCRGFFCAIILRLILLRVASISFLARDALFLVHVRGRKRWRVRVPVSSDSG